MPEGSGPKSSHSGIVNNFGRAFAFSIFRLDFQRSPRSRNEYAESFEDFDLTVPERGKRLDFRRRLLSGRPRADQSIWPSLAVKAELLSTLNKSRT